MKEEPYDWVDDEDLDLEETMRRLSRLEPAIVVTAPHLLVVQPAQTQGGKAVSLTESMSFFGSQRQAATFA
ncbi:MAG TPA: hypothetical protein VFM55_06535 [Micromonosporaceae bacterium]|nr:hypothetical protein [Micromonosporaceae bacterium]